MIRYCLLSCLLAGGATAQETSLSDRLRALAAPAAPDLYADDRKSDLDLIARHADPLFGPEDARMVIFVGPDCAICDTAEAELRALAAARGAAIRVLDTREPANAALMRALTLDALPSYVMADRLIRGEMPGFVLGRYLAE